MIPFSILDLSQVGEGGSVSDAFANTARMAAQAEALGYNRYWLAEHHGMPGVASSATAVAIAHVGHHTTRIRIGSGGIMLPNHAPLVIAEQFGTLEALFPGRVDLGVGRAPGTDMRTARALRRNMDAGVDNFPYDVAELQTYMEDPVGGEPILAVPGYGAKVPVWVLGSSTYGAQLAAQMGLPYAFASHFAPDQLHQALRIYRSQYRPNARNPEPKVMVGVMGVAADTDEEAHYLFSSMRQAFAALRRNERRPFPKPVHGLQLTPEETQMVDHMLRYAVVGSPQTVERTLENFIAATEADELIVSMPIHDIEARLKSVGIFSRSSLMKAAG
ncbi:MAG: LLM class flavin-dependent oxidoreductase [Asticcacaulis sp.]